MCMSRMSGRSEKGRHGEGETRGRGEVSASPRLSFTASLLSRFGIRNHKHISQQLHLTLRESKFFIAQLKAHVSPAGDLRQVLARDLKVQILHLLASLGGVARAADDEHLVAHRNGHGMARREPWLFR